MSSLFRYTGTLSFLFVAFLLMTSSCAMRGGAGKDFIPTPVAPLEPNDVPPELILERYFEQQANQPRLQDYEVDVTIEAKLPAMKRQGILTATRVLRGGKQLSYKSSNFTGDNSIKGDVIARYLNAERDSLRRPLNVGINQDNYRFVYRGVAKHNARRAHVFEVVPKHKRIGLYRGELWIDVETAQPLREFGRFVSNPSVFLKDVDFVRDYWLENGRSLPSRVITSMDTRLVGPAEIVVTFHHYVFPGVSG